MCRLRLLTIPCSFVLLMLLWVAHGYAGSVITGKYVQQSGREIVLELMVGTPAPGSLILKQQLPPGTRVIHAAPPVKKYNPANGMASWLITGLQPGRLTVRLQLDKPLSGPSPVAEVRCRNPVTGEYVTTKIP